MAIFNSGQHSQTIKPSFAHGQQGSYLPPLLIKDKITLLVTLSGLTKNYDELPFE